MRKILLILFMLSTGCMTNEERKVVYPAAGKATVKVAKWYYFGFDK